MLPFSAVAFAQALRTGNIVTQADLLTNKIAHLRYAEWSDLESTGITEAILDACTTNDFDANGTVRNASALHAVDSATEQSSPASRGPS